MSGRPAALVTGASNGIGASFVRLLGGAGYDLVMVARGAPALERVADEVRHQHDVATEVIAADLADQEQLAVVEARAASVDDPIELLVNNAGVGSAGAFIDLPIDGEVAQVDLNITALVRLTHAVLPGMVGRGRGGIINVSSLGGFQPAPLNATYSATKAFVLSFTEAVHEEVLGSGVQVSCLCPGFTRTGFQERSGMSAPGIPEFAWQSADQVAEAGWAGWQQNRAVVVPGALNKATVGMVRVLPRVAVRKMAKRVADTL
jgi:short-subunit dehydrogenase